MPDKSTYLFRLGDVVIDVTRVRKSLGGRLPLDDVTSSLLSPSRRNCRRDWTKWSREKYTDKMLHGKEKPDSGEVKAGDTVSTVSVGQERMDELNPDTTVFEEISEGLDNIELGTQFYLPWFGFKGGQQQSFVKNRSGGEHNRIQLAKIMKAGGNLIILDEPFNDLDVEILRSLEEALLDFAGCVMVVSHDQIATDPTRRRAVAAAHPTKTRCLKWYLCLRTTIWKR
jgi:sulfate-transporting ATPase